MSISTLREAVKGGDEQTIRALVIDVFPEKGNLVVADASVSGMQIHFPPKFRGTRLCKFEKRVIEVKIKYDRRIVFVAQSSPSDVTCTCTDFVSCAPNACLVIPELDLAHPDPRILLLQNINTHAFVKLKWIIGKGTNALVEETIRDDHKLYLTNELSSLVHSPVCFSHHREHKVPESSQLLCYEELRKRLTGDSAEPVRPWCLPGGAPKLLSGSKNEKELINALRKLTCDSGGPLTLSGSKIEEADFTALREAREEVGFLPYKLSKSVAAVLKHEGDFSQRLRALKVPVLSIPDTFQFKPKNEYHFAMWMRMSEIEKAMSTKSWLLDQDMFTSEEWKKLMFLWEKAIPSSGHVAEPSTDADKPRAAGNANSKKREDGGAKRRRRKARPNRSKGNVQGGKAA